MSNITISFNDSDPDEEFLLEKINGIGRKNRNRLIKILARNAVRDYGIFFEPEYIASLLAILENGISVPGFQQMNATNLAQCFRDDLGQNFKNAKIIPGGKKASGSKNKNSKEERGRSQSKKSKMQVEVADRENSKIKNLTDRQEAGKNVFLKNDDDRSDAENLKNEFPVSGDGSSENENPKNDFYKRMGSFLEDDIYNS